MKIEKTTCATIHDGMEQTKLSDGATCTNAPGMSMSVFLPNMREFVLLLRSRQFQMHTHIYNRFFEKFEVS